MNSVAEKLGIAIVTSVMAQRDAISNSVRETFRALAGCPDWEVTAFAANNAQNEIPVRVVEGVDQLLLDGVFRRAELIIYHFGIYYPLFDAILVGNGRARQVVRFHNITPKALVPETHHVTIDRSFVQLHNIRHAQRIWADSPHNREVLIEHGLGPSCIEVLPLIVDKPALSNLRDKLKESPRLIFVGRIVPSKGLSDALEAFHAVIGVFPDARLTVIGNSEYSDRAYLDKCTMQAKSLGILDRVSFAPSATEEELASAYRLAHVLLLPTYHEGFCVPVIEALRAGAIPVGYNAGNMPHITDGNGRLVKPGDRVGLATALSELLHALHAAKSIPTTTPCLPIDRATVSISDFDATTKAYVQQFALHKMQDMYRKRSRTLLASLRPTDPLAIRLEINVLPDDVMRDRERSSLNRLPDISDWEPGKPLTELMRDMRQPICVHRKGWEYALCIHGLDQLGKVTPDAEALAVGAGSETPLFFFANRIKRMVATDLYDNPDHEGTPAMLADPKAFAPFPYRESHLEVLRMSGDKLEFDDNTFDFVFTLSSIEHFGSRNVQRKAVDEIARVMKPGGVACIITELILTWGQHKEYFTLEEIGDIFLGRHDLELVGGDLDLTISSSLVEYPVDLDKSRHVARSPHIVLRRAGLRWTFLSMFLQKKKHPAQSGNYVRGSAYSK
jgi:glycosyltransferase involved in cell wall biosynthesis/SAM-dependent methyltransferase